MDREKLNKAAEESRMASAETRTTFGTHHYIDDVVAVTKMSLSYDEVAESAFIKGAEWLMQQPLSERLTEEEKEKIKGLYKDFEQLEKRGASLSDRATGCSLCHLLTTIFGSDLFK